MSKKNKILIVDDDKHNLNICKAILEEDYFTEVAYDGVEAIRKLENFAPDIILMDWDMPVLNGLETLKKIKNNPSTSPIQIIMMTGMMTDQKSLLEAFQNGIIDFIKKPFETLELKARVNSVLQSVNYYRSEIDARNHELVWLTLRLSENIEFIETALEQIDEILDSLPNNEIISKMKIRDIKNNMSSRIIDSTWKQFEMRFKDIHPDFYKKLSVKHPSITPAELRLAALLYLNLNTKEIAGILHQTMESVKVSRTRLRKKLAIEDEIKLATYLMQI